jgi:hypothetical protein
MMGLILGQVVDFRSIPASGAGAFQAQPAVFKERIVRRRAGIAT